MRLPSRLPGLLALAAALAVSACGSSTGSSTGPSKSGAQAGPRRVVIAGYAFKPATLTVKAGTRVTFVNRDKTAHTATSQTTGFDTGTIAAGRSATVTASKPGTYSYYCQFHAFMVAKLIVSR
jgi:plastocyanin